MIEPIVGGVLAAIAVHNAQEWWKRRRKQKAPMQEAVVQVRVPRHPVLDALKRAGRPLTNKELAAAMGVSPSYASRLRRQVDANVRTHRVGRCVYVSLAHWTVN